MVGKGFIQDEGAIICPECARKKNAGGNGGRKSRVVTFDEKPKIHTF